MIRTRHVGKGSFTTVDAVFGVLGFVAGLGAAIYGYALFPSLALAIFVFAAVSYLVGRGLPDVITEDLKAQRAAYFALLPAVGAVVVYASYLLWEGMWLAVILGFVAGGAAQALLGRTLFPMVRKEEQAEELDRAGIRPEEWGEPGPDDLAYRGERWYLGPHDIGYRWYSRWRRHHAEVDHNGGAERSTRRVS
jgi:hypothetical protein